MATATVTTGTTEPEGAADVSAPGPAVDLPPPQKAPAHPPVGIKIPAIKVSSAITRIGLNLDRTVQVPRNTRTVGWYTGSAPPGQVGSAVMIGHRDNRTGPAVFYRLAHLERGDIILIQRRKASPVRYVVRRVAQFPRSRFPTAAVYGRVPDSQLRLVTCGGKFDSSIGEYRDNVVVFAARAKTTHPKKGAPRSGARAS